MQLGIGKAVFPSWMAAVTLVKDHGTSAVTHATSAIRAGTGSERLDHAVRAMTSFDHAITNTEKLPVKWFVPNASRYYRGYAAARQAVDLLVGSGLIPGAKERVGRQSLLAARDTFMSGVEVARAETGRFRTHLAGGWLDATMQDALAAVKLLQSGDNGRALLAGISQVRAAVAGRRTLDEQLVAKVGQLFDRAGAQLTSIIDAAVAANRSIVLDQGLVTRTNALLGVARDAAAMLVADADAAAAAHLRPDAARVA
jgi:hypothetical protein